MSDNFTIERLQQELDEINTVLATCTDKRARRSLLELRSITSQELHKLQFSDDDTVIMKGVRLDEVGK